MVGPFSTYHGEGANANAANCSPGNKNTVRPGCRLHDGADVEDDDDNHDGSLAGNLVGQSWHEQTPDKGTELEHAGHEALSKGRDGLREDGVELGHDVDDGDDALVVAEGEAAHGGEQRRAKDEPRVEQAHDTSAAIGEGLFFCVS